MKKCALFFPLPLVALRDIQMAEGVETKKQLKFLLSKQCNEVQGYYFSKPITA